MSDALGKIARRGDDNLFWAGWWFEPFAIGIEDVVKRLPEIVAQSKALTAWDGDQTSYVTASGATGVILCWPDASAGIASLLKARTGQNVQWIGCWPFMTEGAELVATVEEVLLDGDGLQALVRGRIAAMLIDWHDPFFALDAAHYGQRARHKIAFAGFAHSLSLGCPPPVVLYDDAAGYDALRTMNPDAVRADGGIEIRCDGMAALLPAAKGPCAFYEFHGPVVAACRLPERLLGSVVWRLDVLVARLDEPSEWNLALPIFVTETVLGDRPVPEVGEDVGGCMRLQGVMRLRAVGIDA